PPVVPQSEAEAGVDAAQILPARRELRQTLFRRHVIVVSAEERGVHVELLLAVGRRVGPAEDPVKGGLLPLHLSAGARGRPGERRTGADDEQEYPVALHHRGSSVVHATMSVSPGFSSMFCFRFLPSITSL